MSKPPLPNQWIAASLQNGEVLLWQMQGEATVSMHRLEQPETCNTTELAQLAAQAGLEPAPIFATGLPEAPRSKVPASCVDLPIVAWKTAFAPIHAIGSLVQQQPRGQLSCAAVQISGFLTLNPNWDGVVCCVGGRSSWALTSANEVVSFESTLSPHLAQNLGCGTEIDPDVMKDAIADSLSRPEALAARLSAALSASLPTSVEETSKVWGHLLGAELAATRPYWLGQNLALIAPAELAALYQIAFENQFLPVTVAKADHMTLTGLIAARRRSMAAKA